MTREVSEPISRNKLSRFVHLIIHKHGPFRNWRFFPTKLLLRKLHSESAEIRAYAAEGLGNVGDTFAVAPLIEALSDDNATVRRFAISSLGHLRDARAIDSLITFLGDDESDMRCAAVVALGELGLTEERDVNPPIQVIDALIHSVMDSDRIVNPQAISALNTLAENTESEWIRRYISEALHQISEQNE